MTGPTPHGYTDYGRYLAQSDVTYFDQYVADIDAQTDYGSFFVGDVPYVKLRFDPFINHQRVELRFYTTAALATPGGSYRFDVRNGSNVDQSVPVLGSYLIMRVIPSAINSEFSASLMSMPYGGRVPGVDANASRLIGVSAAAIGAGATSSSSAGNIWPGEAAWSVRTPMATFDAFLESESYTGVFTIVDEFTQVSTDRIHQVFLPSARMRLRVVNTTAAASTVSYYLNARTSLFDA